MEFLVFYSRIKVLNYLLYWDLISGENGLGYKELIWHIWQANHALLEEIQEINQQLMDTIVDISNEDVDPTAAAAAAEVAEGTIVKCSFIAVALSPSLKSQYASAQMVSSEAFKLL